jgi:hypothetical protein
MDSRHQYPGANREADREKLDATGTSIFCNDEVVSEEIGRDTIEVEEMLLTISTTC